MSEKLFRPSFPEIPEVSRLLSCEHQSSGNVTQLLTRGKRPQRPLARSGLGTTEAMSGGNQSRSPPYREGIPALSVSCTRQVSKALPRVMQTWCSWLSVTWLAYLLQHASSRKVGIGDRPRPVERLRGDLDMHLVPPSIADPVKAGTGWTWGNSQRFAGEQVFEVP
jgi:hypothetical protein